VLGLDILEANVRACRGLHRVCGLTFAVGDAQSMPVPGGRFDVVVSIESSGVYPSVGRFLAEVGRVLRPGGRFLFADLRPVRADWGDGRTVAGLRRQLRRSGLRLLAAENISEQVARSVDAQDAAKHEALRRAGLGRSGLSHFREIMLCSGSRNYEALRCGALQYWAFDLRK
jgi:SAM-dependent methyltransferase